MTSPLARTEFAQQALTIAEAFSYAVGGVPLEGPVPYKAEMAVPDGPSTGGGARSMQHLRLVPVAGGNAIVIGSCDQIEMTAVVRTWELLSEQYAQRFKGARLPVSAVEYEKLLGRIESFFQQRTMRVEKLDVSHDKPRNPAPAAPQAAAAMAPAGATPSMGWIAGLLLAGAALGSALTFLLLRR